MPSSTLYVAVPFFCPDTPHLTKNPVFMYYADRFKTPNPFSPDVVVDTDDVIDKKLAATEALESQFYEGGANGSAALVPDDKAAQQSRRREVLGRFERRFQSTADQYRSHLVDWYGKEKAQGIKTAEAFEVCEYGRQPSRAELAELFPFFAKP